jgi:exosortase
MWLVAERLGIMEGRQLMAVAAVELLFLVVLGWRLFWNLSGPLLYLVFLVPFGAFVTPILQRFTADFTVVGLNLLGIPNYADNFTIQIPAGTFFVAEACAGLRFLIAAVAFGTFYALLNFRSPTRRAVFMIASVAVPIIANGFRALGIVVLGQILGSAQAAAADHIIYGWVFFSFVMFLLVAAGHPFRETATVIHPSPPGPRLRQPGFAPLLGALLTAALVGVGPGIAAAISARAVDSTLPGFSFWQTPPGCTKPVAAAAPSSAIRFSVRCDAQAFAVQIAAFPARSTAGALVVERRQVTEELGAEDVSVAPLEGIGPGRGEWTIVRTTDPDRTTALASWIDGQPSRSGFAARVAQARDSLFGADHVPVLFTITALEPPDALPAERRRTLDQIRALIEAQPGLAAELRQLSRLH